MLVTYAEMYPKIKCIDGWIDGLHCNRTPTTVVVEATWWAHECAAYCSFHLSVL